MHNLQSGASHVRQQKRVVRKRRPPRSIIQIYGDLLRILDAETSSEKIQLTRIQLKIDVSFDRLKKYIVELKTLDLIEDNKILKVTKKGKQYIQEYGNIVQSIQQMKEGTTGLSPEFPKTAQ